MPLFFLLEEKLREQSTLLNIATARIQHSLIHLQQIDHVNGHHDHVPDYLTGTLAVLHLQHHVGLGLVVIGPLFRIPPHSLRAHLRDGLEEVEHEGFIPRNGNHQQLALHAGDEEVAALRGAVQGGPQHVLGAVEEVVAEVGAFQVADDGGAAGVGGVREEVAAVDEELAVAQRPGLSEPHEELGFVEVESLDAVGDGGLRLRGLQEGELAAEGCAAVASDVLVLLLEDEDAVLGAVDADGAQEVVVEVHDIFFSQAVGHHLPAVLLHPHLGQPRIPLDRHGGASAVASFADWGRFSAPTAQ